MGLTPFFEPVFSGQSMNCSVSHFRVGFKRDWEVDTWVNPMLSSPE